MVDDATRKRVITLIPWLTLFFSKGKQAEARLKPISAATGSVQHTATPPLLTRSNKVPATRNMAALLIIAI